MSPLWHILEENTKDRPPTDKVKVKAQSLVKFLFVQEESFEWLDANDY